MTRGASAQLGFAAIGSGALLAVAAALVTQYAFGMQPCPWCVLQRLIFLLIALACGLGWAWRGRTGRVVAGVLTLLLALGGAAAALWQHDRAAASASCAATFADRVIGQWLGLDSLLPEVFSPRASCADAAVDLLGLPYDSWSLGLFLLAALGAILVLRSRSTTDRLFSRPA